MFCKTEGICSHKTSAGELVDLNLCCPLEAACGRTGRVQAVQRGSLHVSLLALSLVLELHHLLPSQELKFALCRQGKTVELQAWLWKLKNLN